MPSDLFTTSYLGSFAGLVAVTYLLTQFFKEPIRKHLSDWWIRMLAVFIALSIQSFTLYVAGSFTVEAIGLAVLNSFLIAITAAGAHDISQPTNSSPAVANNAFSDLLLTPTIDKPQVLDVSPPIITPQPSATTSTGSEPTEASILQP